MKLTIARCLALVLCLVALPALAANEISLPQSDGSNKKLGGSGKAAFVAPGGTSLAYISTATTTQVKTGAGFLHCITVNATTAFTIGLIDNTSGTTVNIGQLKASVPEGTYCYDVPFATGLRIITGGASDITVSYY